jgi:hypothetical protein
MPPRHGIDANPILRSENRLSYGNIFRTIATSGTYFKAGILNKNLFCPFTNV